MDFVFDQLDTTTCAGCGGSVDVAGVTAFKVIACPHCKADLRVPGKLGALMLQEVVGVGSAGIVYKALDATLHRNVAVKILKNEEGDDKKIVQATVAEARALAAINHANVVHIHTIGMRHGQPYIVMELLVGSGKLNVMLKEGWVADEKRGLEIALDVAQGLKAAQGAGLLHRDVKPGNILFNSEGVAKLLDFSVVHAATGDGEKVVIGTPYYISPEAARGNAMDFRSDIYSLGATVFHLMTGQPVFDGESSRDVMRARLKQRAPDVRQLKPGISARGAGVLARMLETDPADRFGSYEELIADLKLTLDQLVHGEPADIGGIRDFEPAMGRDPSVPVATARRPRPVLAAPPPKSKPVGLIIGLAAAGIAVVVGVILLAAGGGSGDKDAAKRDGGRLASNDRPGETDDPGTRSPPGTDGARPTPPDPDRTTDTKSPVPPVTPVQPVAPVNPPVQPQPPKVDPLMAAMTSWETQIVAELKREPTAWQPVKWTSLRSAGGAALALQADGSVAVTGTNPATDTYVLEVKLDVPPEQVTGLLLEALPDASLLGGGPGRSPSGNFVVTGVAAEVASAANPRAARGLVFAAPAVDFEQQNQRAAGLVDANPQTGWATSPRMGYPNAVMLPVKELSAAPPAPKPAPIVFDNFEGGKLADKWTVSGNAFKDRPYKDGEIASSALVGLAGFEGQHMINSGHGTGIGVASADPKRGTGTLVSKPFKIERRTISFLIAGGKEASTRVQLKVDGNVVHTASGDNTLKLKKIMWDVHSFDKKEATLEIIDEEEKDRRGFIVVDQIEFTDEAVGGAAADGTILRVTITHGDAANPRHTLGKFRVSLTTAKAPTLDAKLPGNIKSIVMAGPQGRASQQAKELLDYYERTKVDGLHYEPPPGVAATTPARVVHKPEPVKPVTPPPVANGEPAPKLEPHIMVELAKLPDKKVYEVDSDALVLVRRAAHWLYLASEKHPDPKWKAADFEARGWALGEAGFGYGNDSRTPLKEMKGKFSAVYARAPFQVDDPAKLGELSLVGRFDDAIAVYINGHEVHRSVTLTGTGPAAKVTQATSRLTMETIHLKDAKKHLKPGVNHIAIECHNVGINDQRFMLDPALVAAAPVVPRQVVSANKHGGWTVHDGKMFSDAAGIYIESTGNDPRIETGEIKTDFDDRAGTVKIVLKIKVETAGSLRLQYNTKPKNAQNALTLSEEATIVASTQVRQLVIDKVRVTGKLQNLIIRLPKGTTQIQSIHVLNEKDNKIRDAWVFGKD